MKQWAAHVTRRVSQPGLPHAVYRGLRPTKPGLCTQLHCHETRVPTWTSACRWRGWRWAPRPPPGSRAGSRRRDRGTAAPAQGPRPRPLRVAGCSFSKQHAGWRGHMCLGAGCRSLTREGGEPADVRGVARPQQEVAAGAAHRVEAILPCSIFVCDRHSYGVESCTAMRAQLAGCTPSHQVTPSVHFRAVDLAG